MKGSSINDEAGSAVMEAVIAIMFSFCLLRGHLWIAMKFLASAFSVHINLLKRHSLASVRIKLTALLAGAGNVFLLSSPWKR